MAKNTYQIPMSLNRSMLDQELKLFQVSGGGGGLPIKVILFYLLSLMSLFWVVTSTFVKTANVGLIVLFVIWWILATIYFGHYSKTQELRIQGVPALISYLPRSARKVMTRSTSPASGFYGITGVKAVDDDGRITFFGNKVGRAYLVVGSASVLVFEADQRAILDRVDSFYRKIDTGTEFIWVTTKEPQRVYRQLANLERRNLELEVRDPDLFALLEEQADILTEYVGRRFNSIHQYLIVRADNDEALRRAEMLVRSEVQDSALMIKSCTQLDKDGFGEMARAVFASAA